MVGFLIVSPFVIAIGAAWLVSLYPRRAVMLAAWPIAMAAFPGGELLSMVPGSARKVELPWAPSLGLTLSFNLDGLGLLFATLITGIGALIVVYSSRYLEGHGQAGRFHASLFAFMGAMLGVVLSDNILTLFVFGELTGFTSFLLIDVAGTASLSAMVGARASIVTSHLDHGKQPIPKALR